MTKSSSAQEGKTKKYIANGFYFVSFEAVEEYAAMNGLRIANTETIRRNTYIITLNKGGQK